MAKIKKFDDEVDNTELQKGDHVYYTDSDGDTSGHYTVKDIMEDWYLREPKTGYCIKQSLYEVVARRDELKFTYRPKK